MNKLVVIGWVGSMRAYLNVSREEALRRYMESEGDADLASCGRIQEFEFSDEFGVYQAWATVDGGDVV